MAQVHVTKFFKFSQEDRYILTAYKGWCPDHVISKTNAMNLSGETPIDPG